MVKRHWFGLVLQPQYHSTPRYSCETGEWSQVSKNLHRKESTCGYGPVHKLNWKVVAENCKSQLVKETLWRRTGQKFSTMLREIDKVKQKTITSSYCCWRWFNKLISQWVNLVRHRTAQSSSCDKQFLYDCSKAAYNYANIEWYWANFAK